MALTEPERSELQRSIAEHSWYHTIELAPGVVTPGWFDTRSAVSQLPFPTDLSGKRCLDVGTFDGFWAFEMEKRGASEVIAIDVLDPHRWDWPWGRDIAVVDALAERQAGGRGFTLASQKLGSSVVRRDLSVYDLSADEVGEFDFIYVGSVLLHLRDPAGALERVRGVARGEALFVDAIDLELTRLHPRRAIADFDGVGRPWWWKPNSKALAQLVFSAGFELIQGPTQMYMPLGLGQPATKPPLRKLMDRHGRYEWITARRGDPHAAILARPRQV